MKPEIESNDTVDQEKLLDRIDSLEKRLVKVESLLGFEWVGEKRENVSIEQKESYSVEKAESGFIEYGLAWLGSIVFFFGIAFLMAYVASLGYIAISRLTAYIATILLLGVAFLMRRSFTTISNVLTICCSILIFYITTKLYFFAPSPVINSMAIVVVLLVIVAAIQLYQAIHKQSEGRASLAIVYLGLTALFANSMFITFPLLVLSSIITLVLFNTHLWWRLHIFSLFLVYLTHLIWLLGNPAMSGSFGLVENPGYSLYFILAYAIVYVASIFIPREHLSSNGVLIAITIWNALAFSLLMLIQIPNYYAESYATIFSTIAVFCLVFSVYIKTKALRDFAPASYASFGFIAMSIALYGISGLPNVYFLLVLQSFLVVSMALWFKSRLLVIANAILFVMLLLAYFITTESLNTVNFALTFTALGTARILNWKKERLTIKTEIYRNVYLIIGAFMLLFAISEALPSVYVTLAWTASAVVFFLFSVLLKLIKYRYIAIITIVVTAGHLFFIDLSTMAIGYRVVAFLVFAIISMGLSLYFTRKNRQKTSNSDDVE